MELKSETQVRGMEVEKRPYLRKRSGLFRFYRNGNVPEWECTPEHSHFSNSKIEETEDEADQEQEQEDNVEVEDENETKTNEVVEEFLQQPVDDDKELELFELLEQMTASHSFCSTSSVITRFINTDMNLSSHLVSKEKSEHNDHVSKLEMELEKVKTENGFMIRKLIYSQQQLDKCKIQNKVLENQLIRNELDLENMKAHNERLFMLAKQQAKTKPSEAGKERRLRFVEETPRSVDFTQEKTQVNPTEVMGMDRYLPNGDMETTYPNGTIKIVSEDGMSTKFIYFNGDIRELLEDGTIKYFYSESSTLESTYPDGTNILKFANGQIEKKRPDGITEVTYINGCHKILYSDGKEECTFTDGSKITTESNGDKTIALQNGQKEFHTSAYRRRVYPNGTVRIVNKDGSQETTYPGGRYRVKDANGNLIYDGCKPVEKN